MLCTTVRNQLIGLDVAAAHIIPNHSNTGILILQQAVEFCLLTGDVVEGGHGFVGSYVTVYIKGDSIGLVSVVHHAGGDGAVADACTVRSREVEVATAV